MSTFASDELIAALAAAELLVGTTGSLPESFTAAVDDSRAAGAGSLFVAIAGTASDGHAFIGAAAGRGAMAAVVERAVDSPLPSILVRDARRAAAVAGAVAYRRPAEMLRLVGVTGTNGKTTVVNLSRAVLDRALGRAASLGTLGVLIGHAGEVTPGGHGLTTPGPIETQRVLRDLADRGVKFVCLEVSSHSLDQRRVEGLRFEVAAFTTFTRDHLDYHGTMDAYFAAKAKLLDQLAAGARVIVNADDPAWAGLPFKGTPVRYGCAAAADVRAEDVRHTARGSEWTLCVGGECADVSLPIPGAYNVGNALCAAAIAHALGARTGDVAESLSAAPQVPGRLEVLAESPLVLRDYAHTPDALERAIAAVRALVRGRLIVVFGCGGDRDAGKRPVMGEIAARLADLPIVTSDNPRTEEPARIIDDIVRGMKSASYERIDDRRDAIERAIELAGPNDAVLIAGKGHETYQIRGTEKLPFDEKEIVSGLLAVRR